jgi:ketosteroid isomerase-like protein
MSRENVDAARRLFKAIEERDLAGVLEAYDPDIVIREASSLPYGGVYDGLEGALRHASAYGQAWAALQAPADMVTDPVFLDAGEYAVVLWRQRGLASDGRKLDLPAVNIYKMRDGKIIESQMFHADTKAILQFLDGEK